MNPWRPTKIEFITFLVLAPVLTLLFNILLFGDRVNSEGQILAYSFPLTFIDLFFFWYLHILVMHWYRIRLPKLNQTLLRLTLLTITHMIMSIITFWVLFKAYDFTHFLGYTYVPGTIKTIIWIAICLTLIATTTWEAEYF